MWIYAFIVYLSRYFYVTLKENQSLSLSHIYEHTIYGIFYRLSYFSLFLVEETFCQFFGEKSLLEKERLEKKFIWEKIWHTKQSLGSKGGFENNKMLRYKNFLYYESSSLCSVPGRNLKNLLHISVRWWSAYA